MTSTAMSLREKFEKGAAARRAVRRLRAAA
jgi:hypothetical protein